MGFILGATGCEDRPTTDPSEFLAAARTGDLGRIEAGLRGNPALVRSKDADGMTPLLFSSVAGRAEVVELLLDHGADITERDAEERTALHHAAFHGNSSTVALLLERGADVGAREFRGRTPLFMATNWGDDLETVQTLIAAGSDVNDRTVRGEEVLFSTLFYGDPAIIDALLDAGARLPDDDHQVGRAVYLAASNGLERVFRIATEEAAVRGIEWWTEVPMQAAARGGSVLIGRELLERGVPLGTTNMYGITPLHIASENGRLRFAEFLLDVGATLDTPSRMGMTALNFAQEYGHDELAARLMELGAQDAPPTPPELRGPWMGQPEPRPGAPPERFALGIVSGHGFNSEHSPAVFSPDGTEACWTRAFRGPISCSKLVAGRWTAPAPASFVSEYGDGEPFFSPDGQRLYFLSQRPLTMGDQEGKENIWYVERTADGWGEPKPVEQTVNEYDHHWEVSISQAGTLYFASTREGTYGGNDLYRSRVEEGVRFPPENLGHVINTVGSELTPFIAPDESYLIFASTGHRGSPGGFRFFISYRGEGGEWMEPMSLDHVTRQVEQPLWPFVTSDGRFLFFIGDGDIWWTRADFIEEMRPRTPPGSESPTASPSQRTLFPPTKILTTFATAQPT